MADLSEQSPLLERTGAGPVTVPSERSTRNVEAVLPAAHIGERSNLELAAVMGSIWVSRSPVHEKKYTQGIQIGTVLTSIGKQILEPASSYPCFYGKSVLVKLRYSQTQPSLPRSWFPYHHPSHR